jgi:crotonobetaine/carnitine-CoA ligase
MSQSPRAMAKTPDGPILGAAFNRFKIKQRVLPHVLQTYADLYGDRAFASLPGAELTFADAPRLAARAASIFESLGIQAGERVALLVGNCIEFIAVVWGQGWRGEVSVPINPALKGTHLLHILQHTRAKVLVIDALKLPDLEEVAPELTHLREVVIVGDIDAPTWPGLHFHRWADLWSAARLAPPAQVDFSAPIAVVFTSGTTGPAKGVVISHHQYYCYAALNVDNHEWDADSHIYTPLPLCHTAAHLAVFVPGFMAGARVTIAERFSASRFWPEVAACGATHASLMGATANILMRQPVAAAERQHRLRTLSVQPPPADLQAFEQRFGVRVLWQAYGQTEGYYNQRTIWQTDKPRSCVGKPSPLFDLEILDDDDVPLPHDGRTIGEIAVRPRQPYVMLTEYFDNPAATIAAFRNQWFHTGDLGSIDADGFLYLTGRKKDSIRRRGENVSASEVEQVALTHPAIVQAAVFAVPAELGEDDIKLDVVLAQDTKATAADIAQFLTSRIAVFMRPRYIQIRESLPMTPTQRVEKYRLQQEGIAGAHYDGGPGGPSRE